jgi:membrane-associated progesterone receptor component
LETSCLGRVSLLYCKRSASFYFRTAFGERFDAIMDAVGLWLLLGGGVFVLGALRLMGNHVENPAVQPPPRHHERPAPRAFTGEELAQYNGTKGQPIYVAVQPRPGARAEVFDVSDARSFYGPGGPYFVFAGKNASRGLAKMSTEPGEVCGAIDDLTEHEKETLYQWFEKFLQKYEVVGHLREDPSGSGSSTNCTA